MRAFECRMCGKCCYGKGGILLTGEEKEKIAGYVGLSVEGFLRKYCEKRQGREGLKVGRDGYCIFYDQDRRCLIHPVKPRICSLWPYYPANVRDEDSWNLAKDACPGINRECSFDEFVKESKRCPFSPGSSI